MREVMRVKKYSGLTALLQADEGARAYFEALPAYVKEQLLARGQGINSLASLCDYAENLTRGDC